MPTAYAADLAPKIDLSCLSRPEKTLFQNCLDEKDFCDGLLKKATTPPPNPQTAETVVLEIGAGVVTGWLLHQHFERR